MAYFSNKPEGIAHNARSLTYAAQIYGLLKNDRHNIYKAIPFEDTSEHCDGIIQTLDGEHKALFEIKTRRNTLETIATYTPKIYNKERRHIGYAPPSTIIMTRSKIAEGIRKSGRLRIPYHIYIVDSKGQTLILEVTDEVGKFLFLESRITSAWGYTILDTHNRDKYKLTYNSYIPMDFANKTVSIVL